MSLIDDVNATPNLNGALCVGLRALSAADRQHVSKKPRTKLLGSVNIENALKPLQPHAHTWDYMVGVREGAATRIHWIEVHPASSTGNIAEIEAKRDWLMNWMRATPLVKYPRRIAWVASGKSAFNSRHPDIKKLASLGLNFIGCRLVL